MKDIKRLAYDIEVFPNFFSVVFIDINTTESTEFYVIHKDTDDVARKLIKFITGNNLVGYNNHNYDDPIINLIFKTGEINPTAIYDLSVRIISSHRRNEPIWKDNSIKGLLKPYNKLYKSIDLMRILAFDKLFIGLKQCSVNLKHDRIQDLPHRFDMPVELHDIPLIMEYNKNDVIITHKLFDEILGEIELREQISANYKVDVTSASRTYIAKAILNQYYSDYTGTKYSEFKDLRTKRSKLVFSECISDNIKFKSKLFNKMLSDLKEVTATETKDAFSHIITVMGRSFKLGMGGLHSVDAPAIYKEDDNYYIIDADVASFYPRMMLNESMKPEHLDDSFLTILNDLTEERLEAKAKKDFTTADTLKISINSMYGLLNFPNYWLYDPKAAMTVTLNGQLYLMMLIESLFLAGFDVISANTDGVTVRLAKTELRKYYTVCSEWSKTNRFELEYAYYELYVRRDVNNYMTKTNKVREKGVYNTVDKIKRKGAFINTIELSKAYKHPIVAVAINNYYLDGKPIIDTLKEGTDIYDFCKSQKVGGQFIMAHKRLITLDNGNHKIDAVKLQKTNRYFISNTGGLLVKVKKDGKETNLEAGYNTTLLNDFKPSVNYFKDINYKYYEKEANKILQAISTEVNQTKLF